MVIYQNYLQVEMIIKFFKATVMQDKISKEWKQTSNFSAKSWSLN